MNLGILLWNTCNLKCEHCSVNSGPKEAAYMSDEEIFSLIDSSFYDCKQPSIGLSGGEAFLYYDRLKKIIRYATSKKARISINSNGFWGTTLSKAESIVKELKELGVSKLVISIDEFHSNYLQVDKPLNVIKACKSVHLEVDLQFVASKNSHRLSDFLAKHGDTLININCREIPIHPVGRAKNISDKDLFLNKEIPSGLCPSSILSVSAYGNYMPCCNTASHLESLKLGHIKSDNISDVHQHFISSFLYKVLRELGPSAFIEKAEELGYEIKSNGYLDQCHLCYELFKNKNIAKGLKTSAEEIYFKKQFDNLMNEFNHRYAQLESN